MNKLFSSFKTLYQKNQSFINRVLICWFTGITFLFIFELKNYDLHFSWRGKQVVSPDIALANIPSSHEDILRAVGELNKMNPRLILAPVSRRESYILSDAPNVILIPRKGFKPDSDGVIRSLHLPKKLFELLAIPTSLDVADTALINFRGATQSFPEVHYFELMNQKILPSTLRKKIVILNLQDQESEPFATPVGDLGPAEILANMIDNVLLERWIKTVPFFINVLLLLALAMGVGATVLAFPTNIALVGLFIITTSISSLCFFVFDQFYYWLPLSVFLVHICFTYFVFLIYKLGKKEQTAWRLEKETANQKEMDELKRNFLSLFSHDLKTPIAKILSQVDVVDRDYQNPEKVRSGLMRVRRYAYELNQHVRNIIKISQIESNRFELKQENCDLNTLIVQAIKTLQPLADEKHISITTQLEPLFTLKLDKDLLQQILLNIIENAIKYSPANSPIHVSSKEESDFVIVCVKDHGKGISKEDQQRIWEKFSRLNEQNEGTGLGLFLVKYFVEVHGGAVFINSAIGQGSEIGFRLPI
ncbi:MAG: CHASE2 domain-containing protein [Bdellovibrionaceae bacterium]|nr:CHASE2 domain-containing protein [Pseudobdellovibrionaceae bacterium]